METNLKTFPKCCLDDEHFCEVITWKQDFEAELHKETDNHELCKTCDFGEDCSDKGDGCPAYLLLRKILSEKEEQT